VNTKIIPFIYCIKSPTFDKSEYHGWYYESKNIIVVVGFKHKDGMD
jgi:hypothetical protein